MGELGENHTSEDQTARLKPTKFPRWRESETTAHYCRVIQ
jgi:hypothetical protein